MDSNLTEDYIITRFEQVEKDLAATKETLRTLITWLSSELGANNVETLLESLEK